jgi:hypothetical protein
MLAHSLAKEASGLINSGGKARALKKRKWLCNF